MKAPKKVYLPEDQLFCEGYSLKTRFNNLEYISVEALKEWIDQQADKRRTDLGTNFTLSQLEKFIEP